MAGILVVTKATELHTECKAELEALGFEDVAVTDKKNDALNTVICNKKPRLVIMGSRFYQDGTAVRVGDLIKLFPKLNIAVVSVDDFPASRAPDFIWEGAKSYLSLWEGKKEFYSGLQIIREGKSYISPKVQKLRDQFDEVPDTKNKMTRRQKECLIMLCCGLIPAQIGEALGKSKRTIDNHLNSLYRIFHVGNCREMIALAWEMGLVTIKDVQFHNRKKEKKQRQLPEWAVVKQKCDRFGDFE
jgi:DNA-binding NarL/FixJ family response regulator